MKPLAILILLTAGFFLGCCVTAVLVLSRGEIKTVETYYRILGHGNRVELCRTKCEEFGKKTLPLGHKKM